ncbi:hypothetical protein WMY93_009708 [Mugilogobius chulae]|uniref:Uncharacterized protein n=1 Tax=Mugilogobius chulae TaxID=88201 RepID=A0AAW0PDL5_9GOBI
MHRGRGSTVHLKGAPFCTVFLVKDVGSDCCGRVKPQLVVQPAPHWRPLSTIMDHCWSTELQKERAFSDFPTASQRSELCRCSHITADRKARQRRRVARAPRPALLCRLVRLTLSLARPGKAVWRRRRKASLGLALHGEERRRCCGAATEAFVCRRTSRFVEAVGSKFAVRE